MHCSLDDGILGCASMRPRVFPAEDPEQGDQAPALAGASMRPRVFPAEDVIDTGEAFVVRRLQ